ncbi:MAG: hypothetical protein JJU36_15790, partial [Phycisphaeraceae bacterium]|nr:hypothetical protein [Phycisphaeraceae bacterium]
LLLGVSRKRFLASLCGAAGAELDGPTAHITALGVMRGVAMFRVHDVKKNRQAADIAHRWMSATDSPPAQSQAIE